MRARSWSLLVLLTLVPHAGATALAPVEGPAVEWILTDDGGLEDALAWATASGLTVHRYEHLGMAVVVAPAAAVPFLEARGVTAWPNEAEPLHLDQSVPYIGADRVQSAIGSQRTGPSVMVVDTGADSNHPDFQSGNMAANLKATRSGGTIEGVEATPVVDRSGHGSHVAGIVAGSGGGVGGNTPYKGVYSNGRIISFQASTEAADPEQIQVDAAAALEGFDWAIENRDRYDIRVVTNSWGSSGDLTPSHPVTQATLKLYQAGMVVVFSAGNEGEEGTLNRHCQPPWVLCVAAGDLNGARASFSSMGNPPTADPAPYDHPDITAPGFAIRSADPVGSTQLVTGLTGGSSEPLYVDRSGTSMAAPHVAGAAALVAAANPDLSPDQIMDVLVATAKPMADPVHRVGAGYLDVREAYNLAVQTVGARDSFLSGQALKYAGPAIGDLDYAADPLSVGYDSEGAARPLLLLSGPGSKPWIGSSPIAWGLVGVGVLCALVGVRFRKPVASEGAASVGHHRAHEGG